MFCQFSHALSLEFLESHNFSPVKYEIWNKEKTFSLLFPFFSVAVLVYFSERSRLYLITISTRDGLVAKSAMLIKQRRETGVNSCLDHIRSSVPVHMFGRWNPAVNVRGGGGSILAYFNKSKQCLD